MRSTGSPLVRGGLLTALLALSPFAPTRVLAQYEWAVALDRSDWTVTASSSESSNPASSVLDGDDSTFWHSQYSPSDAPLPHNLTVDLGSPRVINGLSYTPRQDFNSNGNIGSHAVLVSPDGESWSPSSETQVAYGTYLNDAYTKYTFFTNVTARYVRLVARSEAQGAGNQWASVAELNVYSADPSLDPASYAPPDPKTRGRWSETVDLPLVPAAGAVAPSGDVVLWSAYRPDLFSGGSGLTETAVWTPGSEEVGAERVDETGHDMFCPGISMDVDGRVVVTGGNDVKKTSSYDYSSDSWVEDAEMMIGRGYQSTATLGDGRIFNIGGSWSGGYGGKNGEIYDPAANTWRNLSGCEVEPMLTADNQGIFRSDNHAWLFAWTQDSVLQAGPSRAMNWYNMSGPAGSWTPAGQRNDDGDAMCGVAAMYDAVAGKVLTAGGSPDYQDSDATTNAHVITLPPSPGDSDPTVETVAGMSQARAFGNAVVLPDGKTVVVGGQAWALPFSDETAAMVPEVFDPDSGSWSEMAPMAVARNYHSIALLLPDATVLSGGGGLCGTGCEQNHFDMQVWQPPYLFNAAGELAGRPIIAAVGPQESVQPGAELEVEMQTTGEVASFALVRYGSSTHTVNTDQRRVPLTATRDGQTYTMTLPSEPGVLLPGYWMLFAMNNNGVPSVSKRVHVQIKA